MKTTMHAVSRAMHAFLVLAACAFASAIATTYGLRAKLSRPLDFLVIADHAEMYGLMPQLLSGDPEILATATGKKWYDALKSGDNDKVFATAMEIVASLSTKEAPIKSDKAVRNAWQAYTALADRYNEPGRFSAVIGFEYTTMGGNNLHRNVLFRGNSSVATAPCRTPSSTVRIRKTFGSTWRISRSRREAKCWPSRTTAT